NAFDEYGSIMGLRHKYRPIHTVQFHPESIGSPNGIEIIKSFLTLTSDA
ncbi:MAG: aminodeoxychorismate/anthranilate synthase component II, partial [Candidatus Thermoplasmatota archaeon]|nr:aminodeoxychorismate/anthranilate synthase component II [Candidatus Thermoplasmatota archaeon]